MTNSKQIFIIAGPNGAGKTTASYTILPQILNVQEFVNADEIAKGLSPFQPEKAGFESGRIMLERIKDLVSRNESFAFETTLATKSYASSIPIWIEMGYTVTLIFFWLNSKNLAKQRVQIRVKEGGHNIPTKVIERRYERGLNNFFNLYIPVVSNWAMFDNSYGKPQIIANQSESQVETFQDSKWLMIKNEYYGK